MTERRTGQYVRLELVWRDHHLTLGGDGRLIVASIFHDRNRAWWGVAAEGPQSVTFGPLHTRAAAERAVEDAVNERMGGEG